MCLNSMRILNIIILRYIHGNTSQPQIYITNQFNAKLLEYLDILNQKNIPMIILSLKKMSESNKTIIC